MIETQSITKTYRNGFAAVKGIDLQVGTGDIFGFLGPNGAGKTTTIRMLDGLLSPTTGKAFIDGIDIQKDPLAVKSIIGVVPESHGYYYWMTAKEYLQYFNSLFNKREKNDVYIDELLKKVGLADKKDVPVGQFSRGMKQRLGIAKSLINRPKVIFLDEPTLGLDPRGQREIQQLLLDINQNDGITIFITSHMLKDIEVLCNTVSIVKDGQMVEQGSIKDRLCRSGASQTSGAQSTQRSGGQADHAAPPQHTRPWPCQCIGRIGRRHHHAGRLARRAWRLPICARRFGQSGDRRPGADAQRDGPRYRNRP